MKINWQGSRQLSKFSNTALFCEKNGFNVRVNERDLGDFHFAPKRGGVIWSTTFAWLLPDSTMTFKGRSDGLVVESDRKKISFCLNNGESILSILNTKLLYSKVFWYKLRYIFYRPYQIQITKYSKQLKYVFQIQVIEILPISGCNTWILSRL